MRPQYRGSARNPGDQRGGRPYSSIFTQAPSATGCSSAATRQSSHRPAHRPLDVSPYRAVDRGISPAVGRAGRSCCRAPAHPRAPEGHQTPSLTEIGAVAAAPPAAVTPVSEESRGQDEQAGVRIKVTGPSGGQRDFVCGEDGAAARMLRVESSWMRLGQRALRQPLRGHRPSLRGRPTPVLSDSGKMAGSRGLGVAVEAASGFAAE